MHVQSAIAQWIGARKVQEDCTRAVARKSGAGVILADGMGGYHGGREASTIICSTMASLLSGECAWSDEALADALHTAQHAIRERAQGDLRNMGATALAVAIEAGALHWLSVGDSPLLLVRDGAVTRLNADHSFTPILDEMVRRGDMTAEQAAQNPQRGVLRSVVAATKPALIETAIKEDFVLPGDFIIASSDGILSLDDRTIAAAALSAKGNPKSLARGLISCVKALHKPDQDNVSLAIFAASERHSSWLSLFR
jgi:serine/threonine protein phosphatase PrpC